MSTAAPPAWVRRLRKRENGVDAGLKVLLITCWGYGPYNRKGPEEPRDGAHPLGAAPERQPAKPVTLWACVETLAEESGQPEGTVKDQLRRAIAKGWIRRDKGSRMTLAWRAPGVFEYGTRTADRPNRTVDQPDGGPTYPDGGPTAADGGPAAARTVGRPQTFHELPIELPTNVVEAREPLPPPPKPRPAQTSLVTGKLGAAQRSAQAQLERERAEVRAKFSGPSDDEITAAMFEAATRGVNRDPWAAKVREASEAAFVHLELTATSTHSGSYSQLMRKARADYSDEGVLEALRIWEAADWRSRPAGGRLWNSTSQAWVRAQLELDSTPTRETKRSPNGQAAFEAVMAKVEARKLAVVP